MIHLPRDWNKQLEVLRNIYLKLIFKTSPELQIFPMGFDEVFNDATNVLGNVVRKIISKKRLLGLDSNWYW